MNGFKKIEMRLGEMKIRGRIETRQTTSPLKPARMSRSRLRTPAVTRTSLKNQQLKVT